MLFEFIFGLLLASLGGFLFGVIYSVIKKQSLRHCTLPFGPFLAAGMVLAMFLPGFK